MQRSLLVLVCCSLIISCLSPKRKSHPPENKKTKPSSFPSMKQELIENKLPFWDFTAIGEDQTPTTPQEIAEVRQELEENFGIHFNQSLDKLSIDGQSIKPFVQEDTFEGNLYFKSKNLALTRLIIDKYQLLLPFFSGEMLRFQKVQLSDKESREVKDYFEWWIFHHIYYLGSEVVDAFEEFRRNREFAHLLKRKPEIEGPVQSFFKAIADFYQTPAKKKNAKKKILLISTSGAGSGHKVTAKAIKEEIDQQLHAHFDTEYIDTKVLTQNTDILVRLSDGKMHSEDIFNEILQKQNNRRKATAYWNILQRLNYFYEDKSQKIFTEKVREINPDLILAVLHHRPINISLSYQLDIPQFIVGTDYELNSRLYKHVSMVNPFLVQFTTLTSERIFFENFNSYLEARLKMGYTESHAQTVSDFIKGRKSWPGFRKNLRKFEILGMPVRKEITVQKPKDLDLARLIDAPIRKETRKILITMGSQGAGQLKNVFSEINQRQEELKNPFDFIFVMGQNKKLKDKLEKLANKANHGKHRFHTIGLLNATQMNALYHGSDLVISKPGGATTQEILTTRTPLLIYDYYPWEAANIGYLKYKNPWLGVILEDELQGDLIKGIKLIGENYQRQNFASSIVDWKQNLREMLFKRLNQNPYHNQSLSFQMQGNPFFLKSESSMLCNIAGKLELVSQKNDKRCSFQILRGETGYGLRNYSGEWLELLEGEIKLNPIESINKPQINFHDNNRLSISGLAETLNLSDVSFYIDFINFEQDLGEDREFLQLKETLPANPHQEDWRIHEIFPQIYVAGDDEDRLKTFYKNFKEIGGQPEKLKIIPKVTTEQIKDEWVDRMVQWSTPNGRPSRNVLKGQLGAVLIHYRIIKDADQNLMLAIKRRDKLIEQNGDAAKLKPAYEQALRDINRYRKILIFENNNGFGKVTQNGLSYNVQGTSSQLFTALKELPVNWNFLYLHVYSLGSPTFMTGKKILRQVPYGLTTKSYAVHHTSYKEILFHIEKKLATGSLWDIKPIDHEIAELHKSTRAYSIDPPICFRTSSTSQVGEGNNQVGHWQQRDEPSYEMARGPDIAPILEKKDKVIHEAEIDLRDLNFATENLIDQNYSVMMTSVVASTLGDPSAASKFIHKILNSERGADQGFIWILQTQGQEFTHYQLIPPKTKVILLDSWSQLFTPVLRKIINGSLSNIAFPTFHYFSNQQIFFLNNVATPFLRFTEYDFQEMDKVIAPESPVVKSGFCQDCIGIFIKPRGQSPSPELATKDIQLKQFLENHPDHELFYAYFNRILDQQHRYSRAHWKSYIKLVLAIQLAKKKFSKTIITIPIRQEQFEEVLPELRSLLQGREPVEISYYNLAQSTRRILKEQIGGSESAHQIIIVNPFPLNKSSVLKLLLDSHPFTGVTGDQSLSEAIEHHKIIFYQTMNWKWQLMKNFADFVSQKLGNQHHLAKFYSGLLEGELSHSQLWEMGRLISQKQGEWVEKMAYIHEQTLKEKNFDKNLVDIYFKSIATAP